MPIQSSTHFLGILGVLAASLLWGTTGTAAAFAPEVSAAAIAAAAMGGAYAVKQNMPKAELIF